MKHETISPAALDSSEEQSPAVADHLRVQVDPGTDHRVGLGGRFRGARCRAAPSGRE